MFESPPFLIVREVLTLASWVERSIFLETSLKTSLGSKSLFPNVKNAKRSTTTVAKRRNRELILRWNRIVQQCYVDGEQCIQRGTVGWAGGSKLVTSGFEQRKVRSTQSECLCSRIVRHLDCEHSGDFSVLVSYHQSPTSDLILVVLAIILRSHCQNNLTTMLLGRVVSQRWLEQGSLGHTRGN